MQPRILPAFLYFGLFLLTIGTLFAIQHWEIARLLQWGGILLNLGFFILLLAEVFRSPKASDQLKLRVGLAYILLPILCACFVPVVLLIFVLLILGSIYLRRLRKRFLYDREGLNTDDFDSI